MASISILWVLLSRWMIGRTSEPNFVGSEEGCQNLDRQLHLRLSRLLQNVHQKFLTSTRMLGASSSLERWTWALRWRTYEVVQWMW